MLRRDIRVRRLGLNGEHAPASGAFYAFYIIHVTTSRAPTFNYVLNAPSVFFSSSATPIKACISLNNSSPVSAMSSAARDVLSTAFKIAIEAAASVVEAAMPSVADAVLAAFQ